MQDKYIGKVYGKWTVLERDLSKKRPQKYFCRCECGTFRSVFLQNLTRGFSSSCSKCAIITGRPYKYKAGDRYNNLEVLRYVIKDGRRKLNVKCDCGHIYFVTRLTRQKKCRKCNKFIVGSTHGLLTILKITNDNFLCQCKCGKSFECKRHNLQNKMPSCGCYWRNVHEEEAKKLEGMKYYYLKIVKFVGMKKNNMGKSRAVYHVKCKCGTTFEKSISYLFGSKSCGCLLKENMPKGSQVYHAKTNEIEVASIRELFKSGLYTRKELADMFGFSYEHACGLIKGKGWLHVKSS